MLNVRVLFAVMVMILTGSSSSAQWVYRYDDGIPDNAIGVALSGQFDNIWLSRYFRHPAFPVITSVDVAFGFGFNHGLQVGSPLEIVVYEDPTGGDARDAVLVRHVHGTVQDPEFAQFNRFEIPAYVAPNFFHVGVVLRAHPGFTYPVAVDYTPPFSDGASTIGWVADTVDITDLSRIPAGQYGTHFALLGREADWLVRANGVPIPEPATSAMVLLSLLLLVHRQRSARAPGSGGSRYGHAENRRKTGQP